MGTDHQYFQSTSGEITGHVAVQTIDATFLHDGKNVNMYFHNYLGPSFFIVDRGYEVDFYPDDGAVFDCLWSQFDGWWNAKGKGLYP